MKVALTGSTVPLTSLTGQSFASGGAGTVLTATGSNGTTSWASNIASITSNGSNLLLGPYVNFASGSNIIFTLDVGPQPAAAFPSNTLRIHGSAGGGSALTISDEGTPLSTSATELNFVGAGVVASGTGAIKTITISGGSGSTTHEDGYTHPDSAGTYDEEFEGTADTLPTNWSWISAPSTWKLNSQWKSWLIADHAASTSETKELRRASVTPGAADFGLWWCWSMGLGQWNNNTSWMQLDLLNSGETEGRGIRYTITSTMNLVSRSLIASVEADVTNGPAMDFGQVVFCGLTRKTSDNTWRYYWSFNGISWTELGGSVAHTLTIDRIRVRFNSGSNVGIERHSLDFVRSRADLLLWAPR